MATNTTEGGALVAILNCILKAFVYKVTVVGSIGFDGNPAIVGQSLKRLLGKQHFVKSKISH